MVLGNESILKEIQNKNIIINPYPRLEQIQPQTVDLALGGVFYKPIKDDDKIYDLTKDQFNFRRYEDEIILKSQEYCLGVTREFIEINCTHIMAKVDGTSTAARNGITAHITAGIIDSGFNGFITLEIYNTSPNNIRLKAGIVLAQIEFNYVTGCNIKYQDKSGYYSNSVCEPKLPKLMKHYC